MPVWETLECLARLSGLGERRERTERIQATLRAVDLETRARQPVGTLSAGLQQRLGIAQALLHDPPILLADEPTASLDPAERVRLRAVLAALGSGPMVIMATHIVADVAAVCPRVAVLQQGRVAFAGATADLAAHGQTCLQDMNGDQHFTQLLREWRQWLGQMVFDVAWTVELSLTYDGAIDYALDSDDRSGGTWWDKIESAL